MAKNLYRLESPTNSEFDTETNLEGKNEHKYVELLPLDGLQQSPQKVTSGKYITYKTNNPDIFWKKP